MSQPGHDSRKEESDPDPHWTKVEEAILLSPFSRKELLNGFLYPGAWAALLLVAGILRFWDLGVRTMHDDEARFARLAWEIFVGEGAAYDPSLHGPLQIQVMAALFFLFGDNEATARLLHAFTGTILVALPYLFRSRLGELGAFFCALMITVSPSLLYFSRFASSDILIAAFSLGTAALMWRYFEEVEELNEASPNGIASKPALDLYLIAAILGLAIASKETAFDFIFIFVAYLMLAVAWRNLASVWKRHASVADSSTLNEILRTAGDLLIRGLKLRGVSKEYSMLTYLATLTLSLVLLAVGLLQVFALLFGSDLPVSITSSGENGPAPGTRAAVALIIAAVLFVAAVGYGLKWNLKVWMIAAVIFFSLYLSSFLILLADTEEAHPGIWQILVYWLGHQDVSGGDQPWFYFILTSLTYEYLPLTIGVIATAFYLRHGDAFTLFLVFWTWVAFLACSLSAVKYPWLLIHFALPLILLSGKFLNDAIKSCGFRHPASIGVIAIAALLLCLTVRTTYQANFRFSDLPVEMLAQKQSSRGFQALAKATRKKKSLFVAVDGTGGFHLPWTWYLRGMNDILYVFCGAGKEQLPTNVDVVFVNESVVIDSGEAGFGTSYDQEMILPHRASFPESIYKELSFGEFAAALAGASAWWGLADYFLNRNIRSESGVCIPAAGEFSCLGTEFTAVYNKNETGSPQIPCSF